jgi:hypothetical protein
MSGGRQTTKMPLDLCKRQKNLASNLFVLKVMYPLLILELFGLFAELKSDYEGILLLCI